MSLANLAAIGSFVSGIAVVFSFIFLALQVRQANQNQRSLIQQARTSRNVEILLKMADEQISELLAKAESEPAGLSPEKIWSFYGFVGAVFWSYEDSYMQYNAGTLHAGSWQSDVATLERILAYPSFRVIWRMVRDGMIGGYRDYIDAVMSKVPADTSARYSDFFAAYLAEELSAKQLR
jgi:hypothetical protein